MPWDPVQWDLTATGCLLGALKLWKWITWCTNLLYKSMCGFWLQNFHSAPTCVSTFYMDIISTTKDLFFLCFSVDLQLRLQSCSLLPLAFLSFMRRDARNSAVRDPAVLKAVASVSTDNGGIKGWLGLSGLFRLKFCVKKHLLLQNSG